KTYFNQKLSSVEEKSTSTNSNTAISQAQPQVQQLISHLKQHPILWGISHVPVNLNIICGIVEQAITKDNSELNAILIPLASMSGLYQAMELKLLERNYSEHLLRYLANPTTQSVLSEPELSRVAGLKALLSDTESPETCQAALLD